MTAETIVRAGRLPDGRDVLRTADVAIRGGRVVDVGRVRDRAHRVIDADGALVVPGAIALLPPLGVTEPDPSASNHQAPGVTTAIEVIAADVAVSEITAYLRHVGSGSLLVDRVVLLDHGALRSEVMGNKVRDRLRASDVDRERMAELLADAHGAGVRGLRNADPGAEELKDVIEGAMRRRALESQPRSWFTAYVEPNSPDIEEWRHQARALLDADPAPNAVVVASEQTIDDPDVFTALCVADPIRLLTELDSDRRLVGPRLNPLALVAVHDRSDRGVAIDGLAASAAAFGLDDRGRLARGRRADLNVLDVDHLLPELTAGVVSTLVGGVEIVSEDELTGERPGRLA